MYHHTKYSKTLSCGWTTWMWTRQKRKKVQFLPLQARYIFGSLLKSSYFIVCRRWPWKHRLHRFHGVPSPKTRPTWGNRWQTFKCDFNNESKITIKPSFKKSDPELIFKKKKKQHQTNDLEDEEISKAYKSNLDHQNWLDSNRSTCAPELQIRWRHLWRTQAMAFHGEEWNVSPVGLVGFLEPLTSLVNDPWYNTW